jgi:uncharacterized membrane protein
MPSQRRTLMRHQAAAPPDLFGRRASIVLLVVAVLWGASIPLAAVVDLTGSSPGRMLRAAVYVIGAGVCHQRPDRSFAAVAGTWPVCARCAGLYLSAAIVGLALGLWMAVDRQPMFLRWRIWALFAAAPTVISWAAERAGLLSTSNMVRFVLAIPLGALAAMMLAAAASGPVNRKPEVD